MPHRIRRAVGRTSDDIAVVTGASKGSIAAAVVEQLLGRRRHGCRDDLASRRRTGWRSSRRCTAAVPAATRHSGWSRPTCRRTPTSTSSSRGSAASRPKTAVAKRGVVKPALKPTLLFPFAAPRVAGDLTDAGGRAETRDEGAAVVGRATDRRTRRHRCRPSIVDARLHVVLPGSPNRGMFGGDGAYGESKAALDALVKRWTCRGFVDSKVTLAHALIGWVSGTGLMGHNDGLVEAVEAAGVKTWSTPTRWPPNCSRPSRPEARAGRPAPNRCSST